MVGDGTASTRSHACEWHGRRAAAEIVGATAEVKVEAVMVVVAMVVVMEV